MFEKSMARLGIISHSKPFVTFGDNPTPSGILTALDTINTWNTCSPMQKYVRQT